MRRDLVSTISWMLDSGVRSKLRAINEFIASGQQLPGGSINCRFEPTS